MVKPPFAAPSEVASERNALLATKLHMPRPRPDLVPRPRLAERLDESLTRGLMLVCAPAGYGKTVLLAGWARRSQQPVAWLSLDVGDNDPARFWRHGVAALDKGRPGLAERVGPLLGPPAPSSYEGLVTALINELAAEPDADETLLVLDDYHLIDSEAVHSSLGFLLEHRPPGLRLVLASRSDPPLALSRLRGRGQLAELRAAELRFTPAEAAALLRPASAGPCGPLSDAVVTALAARTEGWAGETTWAARLIEQYFDELYYLSGEGTTLQRWLSALPDDLARSRPRLLLAQSWLAAGGGRVEAMEPLVDAAERASAEAEEEEEEEPFEPTAGPAASLLVNVPAAIPLHRSYLAQTRGDAEQTAALAAQALAKSREGEWLLISNVQGFLAAAEWLRGRLAEAERAFGSSIAGWREAGQLTMIAWASHHLGQVQRAHGRLDAAVLTYQHALEVAAPPGRRWRRPPARRSWAWPRWRTSGTNWRRLVSTSPRASRCAASSSTPLRWPLAWSRWRGSGRSPVIRQTPWM